MKLRVIAALLSLTLAGCASYAPLPLDTQEMAPSDIADIGVVSAQMPLAELRRHVFDPTDGLDMTEVAMLAVANNPALKDARDALGVARAQAFAAGLLPDPVLRLGGAAAISGPASSSAFDLGLSEDVAALLTRSTAQTAAKASAREVALNLLWLEWQVVSRARELFIRTQAQSQSLALLQQELALLEDGHARLRQAQRSGDVSLQQVEADGRSVQAMQTRVNALEREQVAARADLDALLGLTPGTPLDLVGPTEVPTLSPGAIESALVDLPHRRPDLLALQAGYRSRDARYRLAIEKQFPAIVVGADRARDTGGVNTAGLQLTVSLPLFNRNRGSIAIEKASRQLLHDQYTARWLSARAGIARIMESQELLQKQRHALATSTRLAAQLSRAADMAAAKGDLAATATAALKLGWLDSRVNLLDVERTILEQQVALQTLLGGSPLEVRSDESATGR